MSEAAPALPPIEIDSVSELVYNNLGKDRLIARLSGAFGLLAIVLASIGLYGVMSWTMARRTRETGVRMALGARPDGILRLVLRETLLVVSFGIAIGIPLALAGKRASSVVCSSALEAPIHSSLSRPLFCLSPSPLWPVISQRAAPGVLTP